MPLVRKTTSLVFLGLAIVWSGMDVAAQGQESASAAATLPMPTPADSARDNPALLPASTALPEGVEKPLPINLPTALQLANAQAIDVQLASERVRLAVAQWQQARALWLPDILLGPSYYRHDGRVQDIQGNVFDTSKDAFLLGAGPIFVVTTTAGLFGPLVQRQQVKAQQAFYQAAQNDTMLAVTDAYFQVQQARGELAGALDARAKAEDLVRRVAQLAEVLVPPFEKQRAETEFARRDQAVYLAQERWRVASADLNRILRLEPTTLAVPVEPPQLQIPLFDSQTEVNELIRLGLTYRPELKAHQALVQAALKQLQREKMRPLLPDVQLRGASTAGVLGTFPMSFFGGGLNSTIGNFGMREDYDLQLIWTLQNLGLGNRALIRQQQVQNRLALLELIGVQNRVAAEVTQAHAQVQMSLRRLQASEREVKGAVVSAQENLKGFRQTRKVGELPVLIVRPQEVVAAVQALALAYNDYYGAVADYNRAQFRLYRATGNAAAAVENRLPSPPMPSDPRP